MKFSKEELNEIYAALVARAGELTDDEKEELAANQSAQKKVLREREK